MSTTTAITCACGTAGCACVAAPYLPGGGRYVPTAAQAGGPGVDAVLQVPMPDTVTPRTYGSDVGAPPTPDVVAGTDLVLPDGMGPLPTVTAPPVGDAGGIGLPPSNGDRDDDGWWWRWIGDWT